MKYQLLFFPLWAAILSTSLAAQANPEKVKAALASPSYSTVPLRRLSLFSSGVGFFEHSGTVNGSATILLPFNKDAVNDALKSLTINDPGSSPQVSYTSEQTLNRTLRSLKIDLSAHPSIPELLDSLKGAEIELFAPNPISGRIIGVEQRAELVSASGVMISVPYVAVNTVNGIRSIALKDISTFSFQDPQITSDLNRALDLIFASHADQSRSLNIALPGTNKRSVTVSYVIPAPVWKVSYRLDLSQKEPLLQGWAIVDNDSDTDWNQVELSLVTGRPVSFIQNLYPPYHTNRPTLPLAIAGIAEAQTYASGWSREAQLKSREVQLETTAQALEAQEDMKRSSLMYAADVEAPAPRAAASGSNSSLGGGSITTAQAQAAGDMFEFTIKTPVTLARQQSAMLPLVESTVKAAKYLVFSGSKAAAGTTIHPALSAEITNTTGMKLPAGPLTVYDGGTYAGDALIEFFSENDKRIISYGDELSVSGNFASSNNNRIITSVTVSQGVMIINRTQIYERKYSFNNVSGTAKPLIIEHPITGSATLTEPAAFEERTATSYRFIRTLPVGASDFTVKEERPLIERITLEQLSLNAFVSYATNGEIPAHVRTVLQQALTLRRAVEGARTALNELEAKRARLITEQERTRQNITVVGTESEQGLAYLRRLSVQDAEIDALTSQCDAASQNLKAAQAAYDTFIAQISL
jgi:hypothetical protein